jgi:hypothetical protein
VNDIEEEAYTEAAKEIKRLKALLAVAADAFEPFVVEHWNADYCEACQALIRELRSQAK